MSVFRVRTLGASGDPETHAIEITEEGFSVDGYSGNCLRLREAWVLALGQYDGYPGNLRRDGIPATFTFGVLKGIEQDSPSMEVPIKTRILKPSALILRRSRRREEPVEQLDFPQENVIVITPEGFRVGDEYLGDCLLLQPGQHLVLMRSRETLEMKMRRQTSLGQHIAIAELVEAFGIVVTPETEKTVSEPSGQIPLHPA